MKLGSEKGIKTGRWLTNEMLVGYDINGIGQMTYQNVTDLLAILAEERIEDGSGPDRVIAGLQLIWSTALTSNLKAGAAVSFKGRYLTDDGTWSFVSSSGEIFSIVVPKDQAIAVVSGGAQARYDTIEIRPKRTTYNAKTRDFKDPVTEVKTKSSVETRLEYGYEFQVLQGTEGAGVAPTHTAGWIKIAEVFVDASASAIDQDDIKDVRDSNTWTTEAGATIYRMRWLGPSKTPASASAAGNEEDICWDASYLYICTAPNTWRRIAHATW